MTKRTLILSFFLVSLGINLLGAVRDPSWAVLPATLVGWYLADMMSGLIHMYMDYRPCPAGRRLDEIFFYEGSRESEEYLALLQERMAGINAFERIAYDFKNHHPRPDALGRRSLWRLVGSTLMAGVIPTSLAGNLALLAWTPPGWAMAGLTALLIGGGFAQYFHGALHREHNPRVIPVMRALGLLMSPQAHQRHHATLRRDFATNCGWSNPLINLLFRALWRRGYLKDAGLVPSA